MHNIKCLRICNQILAILDQVGDQTGYLFNVIHNHPIVSHLLRRDSMQVTGIAVLLDAVDTVDAWSIRDIDFGKKQVLMRRRSALSGKMQIVFLR